MTADLVVILCGVTAALHLGKLPIAIPVLRQALGVTLLEAGFLLSLVQLAGMSLGLVLGLAASRLGLRRSMFSGLLILGLASLAGGWAQSAAELLWLRAIEGGGFLLVAITGPALVRQLVPLQRLSLRLGLWGGYVPVGMALALLSGPWVMESFGWQNWWRLVGVVTLLMALWLRRAVPRDQPAPALEGARRLAFSTLTSQGPWLVAFCFGSYSFQWLAVIGFLPAIYAQAGLAGSLAGVLTAVASLANTAGNVAAGRLLHRGLPAHRVLYTGFAAMAAGALVMYALPDAPFVLRFGAVLLFSAVGGLVPGTLFTLAVRVSPHERAVPATVGWTQQLSALGQFAGPPLVAWVAQQAGGWHWTWAVTGTAALLGCVMAARLGVLVRR